jgi:hypothetical protein
LKGFDLMELDTNNKCPVVEVDGFIEAGKQFDIDINLPEDERNVIYGIIKDRYDMPAVDAVVKLVEIDYEKGEEVRKPVSHTFTDEYGEFVFGPLCPDKKYAIDVWVNRVRHEKVCAKGNHKGKCLKGIDIDICDNHKPQFPCPGPRGETCNK